MKTKTLNILHISDVHFQENDSTYTQSRIIDALVNAIKGYKKPIHYCIFTGDLANQALPSEYQIAGIWLKDIFSAMNNPEAKMIICPGNHDISRSSVDLLSVRGAASNQKLLNAYLNKADDSFRSLENFKDWHNTFKAENSWVASLWDQHVNLVSEVYNEVSLNFIMANSALLSADNDDQGNLCIDINQLNACLGAARNNEGLNICMMHHPLEGGWFVDWNNNELVTLFSQKIGCHFLMSGHVHDAEGYSSSNNYGQSLTNFKCGSAYTGGKWKKEFSILEVDINSSQVLPNNYVYSDLSGEWNKNNEQSQSVMVDFSNVKSKKNNKKKA